MRKPNLMAAPQVDVPPPAVNKFEQEHQAFLRLRASLLQTHSNQYVAVHEGEVVDSGEDEIALGLRVYERFGYVPIFVGRASDEPPLVVRIPTPRLRRSNS